MRICHIITGLGDGGAEAVLYRLCTHDPNRGNKHTVISLMNEGKYGAKLRQANIEVHHLNLQPGRVTLRGILELWRLLRLLKPNIVQTWMYHADFLGGVLARIAGVSNVIWGIHNTTLESGKAKRGTILLSKLLALLSYWIPKRIVVCAMAGIKAHGEIGYSTKKMTFIPNGYDLNFFAPDTSSRKRLREELKIDTDPSTILLGLVGRYHPDKDIDNFLKALSLLRKRAVTTRAILIGSGLSYENKDLAQKISSSCLTQAVTLLGPRNDIPAIMNALDILILPSSAEAFPNVLAEAMACGIPCVTTNVGDAPLLVKDTGWIVPPKNAAALADGIEAAINEFKQPGWLKRKQHARDWIKQNFAIERMCTEYQQIWSDLS